MRSKQDEALLEAVQRRRPDDVEKWLNAGANPNAAEQRGRTPLFFAVTLNMSNPYRAQMLNALFAKGADARKGDMYGYTPLHGAASSGNCDLIDLLLNHQADINAQAANGMTPFHFAAIVALSTGNTQTLAHLLERGANSAIRDAAGETALDMARSSKASMYHAEIVDYLQKWESTKPDDRRWAEKDYAAQPWERATAQQNLKSLRHCPCPPKPKGF